MNKAKLRNLLIKYFNSSDLDNLCFDLNIEYESIAGNTKEDKARELITHCFRHGILDTLVNRCRELRPHVDWNEFTTSEVSTTSSDVIKTQSSVDSQLETIRVKLQSLQALLDIQVSNLNQLQIDKAKYGGIGVPPRVEHAIQDINGEIEQTETQMRKYRMQLAKLGGSE